MVSFNNPVVFDAPFVPDSVLSTEDFVDQNGRTYQRYVRVPDEGVPSISADSFSVENSISMNANLGQCPTYFKQNMFDFSSSADKFISRIEDEEQRSKILSSFSDSEKNDVVEPSNDVNNE